MLQQPCELRVITPCLELGKLRLREGKSSPRVNGGKAKAWIYWLQILGSPLPSCVLSPMLSIVPLGWNYYFTFGTFRVVLGFFSPQHLTHPASHCRSFSSHDSCSRRADTVFCSSLMTWQWFISSKPCPGACLLKVSAPLEADPWKRKVLSELGLLQLSWIYHPLSHLHPGGILWLVLTNGMWVQGRWVHSGLRSS